MLPAGGDVIGPLAERVAERVAPAREEIHDTHRNESARALANMAAACTVRAA